MLVSRVVESIDHTELLKQNGLSLAQALHTAVLRGGQRARALADLFHGTPLGHPLHPILTDIPIGAWSLAALCDLIATLRDPPEADRAADMLISTGVVAAVPTAMAGAIDYSTVPRPAASVGALHGMLNTGALVLYLLSLRERHRGRRSRGRRLAAVAYAIVGASAALGGDLVYRHRVGVNHSEQATGPREWTPVLAADDLPQQTPVRVAVEGSPVLLYRQGEQVRAVGAVCSHAGGPLEEGQFENGCVQCPWHDSVFDLRDGRVVHGPATVPQPAYAARLREGNVEVRFESRAFQHT